MDYKQAYEGLKEFVDTNEFEGVEVIRGMFKDVDELINKDEPKKEVDPFEEIINKYK